MKLCVLLIMWLVHIFYFKSADGSQTDLKDIYGIVSEEMLLALKNSFDNSGTRYKRELPGTYDLVDDSGVHRLMSIKPVAKLCYPAIRTLFVYVGNYVYAICLSRSTLKQPAEVVVGYYKEHTWTPFQRWWVMEPASVTAFHDETNLYVLVAENDKENGTDIRKISLKGDNDMEIDHAVTSGYPTNIALWKMKFNGEYNLAIANTRRYRNIDNFDTEVFIYMWMGTFFNYYAKLKAYDVKDMEPFHIHRSAYIAIANFKKSRNNNEVDSEIFRYNMDSNSWVSHQRIRTYGAMDWEFFTLGTNLGREFFLAVANNNGKPETRSMIYKFVEDKFLPFQCLQTTRATSFTSYSDGSYFVLAVANKNDAVHFYQYDGWRFIPSIQSTKKAMSHGVVHLDFHKIVHNSGNSVILSVSNPEHPDSLSIFELEFKYENTLQDWRDKSEKWCFNVLSKLEQTDIDGSVGNFNDVIFKDLSQIEIKGDLVFENGFETKSLKTPKLTEITSKEVYVDTIFIKLSALKNRLQTVQSKLKEFASTLQKALRMDGPQNITSHLMFQNVEFACSSKDCYFENVYADFLNGENISGWSNRLIFLDSENVIARDLRADQISATSVYVRGLVDSFHMRNLVTKSGKHNITAHKNFKSFISAPEMKVGGEVDKVEISSRNILLTTGYQKVYGNIVFEELNTVWLNADYINNRNFTEFYKDLMFTGGSFTVSSKKSFKDVAIDKLAINLGCTLNGVDLIDLWSNTFWKDGKQDIKAEVAFYDVLIQKNLKVSNVNGIQIPGQRVVDITEQSNITASHTFQNIFVNHLSIFGSLNGMPLVSTPDGSKQLNIMLKHSDQIVAGIKTYHTIHLDADSYVSGTVDGVDLSSFKASVLRKNESIVTNGTWVFNNLVIKGPLSLEGKISGLNLKEIYSRALKLKDSKVPDMIFDKYINIQDLQCENINELNLRRDLVLVNEFQNITGIKTFNKIILKENSLVNGLVNNLDINFLYDITLIGNQTIKSKMFHKDVSFHNLSVLGTINGIPVEKIVTLKGGQIFASKLLNATFTDIEATNVEATGKVNGISLDDMIDTTVTYNGYQIINGRKIFSGTIFVMSGTNLQTDDLNGIDLKKLWDDSIFIDVPQHIEGKKTFEGNVVFDNFYFNSTFDTITPWDMKYNWMLKDVHQKVECEVIFADVFYIKNLNVGVINGININELESEIVKLDDRIEIEGPIEFENSVLCDGDVSLTGVIQGISLSEEFVQRDVIVTAEKTFLRDLLIEGDLTVDGKIDGVHVEELYTHKILGSKRHNISNLVIQGNVIFLSSLFVRGSFAGIDPKLLENTIKDSTSIEFAGKKTFSNITFEGPITLKGKLGNVYLKELSENYMSLTKDETIQPKMQFEDLLFKDVLSTDHLYTEKINNINLLQLESKILKISGFQQVNAIYHIDEVVFEGDVFVVRKVNGLELPEGVMRHNRSNIIQGSTVFKQNVTVQNIELEEGRTIQDIDVSDWHEKAVLKQGKYEICGYKTFHRLDLNDIKVQGLFDSLEVSEDKLLMTYGNQVINKPKTFNGLIVVEGSLIVTELINGVDLAGLSTETIQKNRNNTITGLIIFSQPLTLVFLEAPTISGVDVLKINEMVNTPWNFHLLGNQLYEIEEVVTNMKVAFENQAVLFQYYELYREFNVPTAYDWLYVSGKDCGELMLLSVNSSLYGPCSSIKILEFDKPHLDFIHKELTTSYAVSVKSLMFRNETYVFVANENSHTACSSKERIGEISVDIYIWGGDNFEKLQSLSARATDMASFTNSNAACLVILEHKTTVYCALKKDYSFKSTEILVTTGGKKVSAIEFSGEIILAVTAEDVSDSKEAYIERKHIDIYIWNSREAIFGNPVQVLHSTFAQSITFMNHKENSKLFLVVAEGSVPKIYNEPRIIIYKYDGYSKLLKKYQEIKDYGAVSWINLNTGELLFFIVDSLEGRIKVYQYKEAGGFVLIDIIKSLGTLKAHPFIRSNAKEWFNHYLALAGPRTDIAQPTQGADYAKILKSKVKGRWLFY